VVCGVEWVSWVSWRVAAMVVEVSECDLEGAGMSGWH